MLSDRSRESLNYYGRLVGLHHVYNVAVRTAIKAAEAGIMPDLGTRAGIRQLLAQRVREASVPLEEQCRRVARFAAELRGMPVAICTDEANREHYEVPTEYFLLVLGRHLKYSSCFYNSPNETLSQAEENMLALCCQRAELKDGQDVLELGCGWGSLSLFMASRFPGSTITAVSNSRTQRELIEARVRERGLKNLKVITANVVELERSPASFDRVVSVEMFEHMKNYEVLLDRISRWLKPGGKLFVHMFVHRSMPYHFQDQGEDDWMGRHFFTGGTMVSLDLLSRFQHSMTLENLWYVNGTHYSRTLEAWLRRHDELKAQVMPIMERTYGGMVAGAVWFHRWRIFYMACSELFNYNGGEEWGVGHYLLCKR